MKSAIVAASFAAAALAAPAKRQATAGGPSDGVILNYALTLEHLENHFYQEVLAKFSLADFQAVGLDNVFYNNLQELAKDEATHVEFLTTALTAAGVTPVVANEYDFGLTDVESFFTLDNIIEGVGVSAYLGAAQYIKSGSYLTAAAAILTVEGRHNAYVRASTRPDQLSPFPFAFDTPLTINEVYTLVSPFITKNNNPNADLPVMAYTGLSYAGGPAAIGSTIKLTAAKAVTATEAYFIAVTGPIKAVLTGSGEDYSVTIPTGTPNGQSYCVLTSGGVPTDTNTVAGPAIVEIQDNQYGVIPDEVPCKVAGSYGSGSSSSNSGSSSGSAPSYGSGSSSSGSVQQIGDGQIQAPAAGSSTGSGASAPSYGSSGSSSSGAVQQIGDGQIQEPAVQQIGDGQIQEPAYGSKSASSGASATAEDCEESAPAYSS